MLKDFIKKHIHRKESSKPVVLWWGRHDSGYSRNRMVWSLFESLGWQNVEFRPLSSDFGCMESVVRNIQKPDLVWVASFRHRDAVHACMGAKKWRVPVIFDPLISSYEKDVFERRKWPEGHKSAVYAKKSERNLFSRADLVVADTKAHADFFIDQLGVDRRKTGILYVGAEEKSFAPYEKPVLSSGEIPEILFYGSFLELHGVDVIVRAAMQSNDIKAKWVLLGDGPCRHGLKKLASGCQSVVFEDPVPYSMLPSRIVKADILLGVFGATKKSDLVIPNKIFQAMAMAKPVITQKASAYPDELAESGVIGWTDPGSPDSLAEMAESWLCEPVSLLKRGMETRTLYDRFFSGSILEKQLCDIVSNAFLNMRKGI